MASLNRASRDLWLLRLIFDQLPLPIFYKNKNLRYQYCNLAFSETLLGTDRQKIYNHQTDILFSRLKSEFQNQFLAVQKKLLTNPGLETLNLSLLNQAGETKVFNFHLTTITSTSQTVVGLFGYLVGITNSPSCQVELKESDNLIQHIIDLLPVGVFWKNRDFKYIGCNQVFAKDANKTNSNEIIGKDDFQLYPKDRADRYRQDDLNVIKKGKAKINQEERRTLPTKKDHWIRLSKVPLTDSTNRIIGVLGVYDDITTIKKAQDDLTEKLAQLEKMNKFMVGRELKMIELKNQITLLQQRLKNT